VLVGRLLTTAVIGMGRHTGVLTRPNIAKHCNHCIRIERSSRFEAVLFLELHEGLLGLWTDHAVNRTVIKSRVPQLQLRFPDVNI